MSEDPYSANEPISKTLRRIIYFIKERTPDKIVERIEVGKPRSLQYLEEGIYAQTYLIHVNERNEFSPLLSREIQDTLYHIYRLKEAWLNSGDCQIAGRDPGFIGFSKEYSERLNNLAALLDKDKYIHI